MKIANPPRGEPTRVAGDYAYYGEGTPDEEIVHVPTQRSNVAYYTPEMVLNPEGCDHEFYITDIGKREIECRCGLATTFIAGINYFEEGNNHTIKFKDKTYPVKVGSQ